MRDHTKLRAFELADKLALSVCRATRNFPKEEMFGLKSQMRRAAVSIASNIVEGCGRHTQADYIRFLDIAYGSSRELEYQVSLSRRLGFLDEEVSNSLRASSEETAKVLNGLIRSLRRQSSSGLQSPASSLSRAQPEELRSVPARPGYGPRHR